MKRSRLEELAPARERDLLSKPPLLPLLYASDETQEATGSVADIKKVAEDSNLRTSRSLPRGATVVLHGLQGSAALNGCFATVEQEEADGKVVVAPGAAPEDADAKPTQRMRSRQLRLRRDRVAFVPTGLGDGPLRVRFEKLYARDARSGRELLAAVSLDSAFYRRPRRDGLSRFVECSRGGSVATTGLVEAYLSVSDARRLAATCYSRAVFADLGTLEHQRRLAEFCDEVRRARSSFEESYFAKLRLLAERVRAATTQRDPRNVRFLLDAFDALTPAQESVPFLVTDLRIVRTVATALRAYLAFGAVVARALTVLYETLRPRRAFAVDVRVLVDDGFHRAVIAVLNFYGSDRGDVALCEFALKTLRRTYVAPFATDRYAPDHEPVDLDRARAVLNDFCASEDHDEQAPVKNSGRTAIDVLRNRSGSDKNLLPPVLQQLAELETIIQLPPTPPGAVVQFNHQGFVD